MSLQVGEIIENKYRIIRVLGQGGMGAVYEGENTRIHRRVAIKILHAAVATKADIVQRFEREAQAAGRIGSEHIVEVLDLGNLPSGERFMVMEFLDGEALADRIKAQGKLTAGAAAPILRQLLTGLGAAHDAGIIHRDLKPDNVFLVRPKTSGRTGPAAGVPSFVKLVDFGVSKFSALDNDSFSMTRTGAVMGTPYYMSPEQARGQTIDHRSDLYSVGVVGYQMITGRVPFNADTFNELLFKIALESPEPAELLSPGLDPYFAQIIMRGMARDPNHRFQSAAEFAYAIDQWCAHNPASLSAGSSHELPGRLGQSWPRQTGPQLPQVQVAPSFATSQPGVHAPPMTPGGMHPTTGQHPLPNQMLSQSQVALAVTNRESKRSGALIAVAVVAVLCIGGGIAAFKFIPRGEAKAAAAPTAAPIATDPPRVEPSASAAPVAATTTTTTTTSAPVEPTPEPSAQTVAQTQKPPVVPAGPGPGLPTKPQGPPPTKPPPTTSTGGRQISGGL